MTVGDWFETDVDDKIHKLKSGGVPAVFGLGPVVAECGRHFWEWEKTTKGERCSECAGEAV